MAHHNTCDCYRCSSWSGEEICAEIYSELRYWQNSCHMVIMRVIGRNIFHSVTNTSINTNVPLRKSSTRINSVVTTLPFHSIWKTIFHIHCNASGRFRYASFFVLKYIIYLGERRMEFLAFISVPYVNTALVIKSTTVASHKSTYIEHRYFTPPNVIGVEQEHYLFSA